jgi:RNA polymerase sigma-70 factor, ECF subfamily
LHAAIATRLPFAARAVTGATTGPREPTDSAGTTGAFRRRTDGVASLRSDIQERAEPRRDADAADSVARAAAGDARAFESLYHAHLPRVHSLVRRMTGGRDTDELTQDVFVRVWQKLGTFRGDSAFTTWLHRLTVNVVIERFRTEATRRQRLRDGEDIFETLPAPARSGDLSMDFETAMMKLPDGAREIFVLHDVEGYKHHEIATLLEISAGTSKAQLHRARMMLRKHLR